MRMAELSRTSGIAVASIKYYQREGILRQGAISAPNQAVYDESHVRRLRLIRALIDVGGLSVAATRRVIEAIDSEQSLAATFAVAQHTVSEHIDTASVTPEALARVDELLAGWHYGPENPGRLAAARVVMSMKSVGQPASPEWLAGFAAAALLAAEVDLDVVDTQPDRDSKAEIVVIGTVLGDALFASLRRVAQEHITHLRYGAQPPKETS